MAPPLQTSVPLSFAPTSTEMAGHKTAAPVRFMTAMTTTQRFPQTQKKPGTTASTRTATETTTIKTTTATAQPQTVTTQTPSW